MPLPTHLSAAADLVTPASETRAGFIKMALEKNSRANPHIAEAKALRARAIHLGSATALITEVKTRSAILAAAGLSAKALKHLSEAERTSAIADFVGEYLDPAGDAYADELTYRFLLTRGDALGGVMRNLAGRLGDERFLTFVLASLAVREIPAMWRHRKTKKWSGVQDASEASKNGNGLHWESKGQPRTLLFNIRVPLVAKNVDSALLRCTAAQACAKVDPYISNAHFYIALGELKGGIDPAGADEHWKTANHTLSRIGQAFAAAGLNPKRYFVGAAIEASMANELIAQLQSGQLANAANLTSDDQISSFCDWLVDL